MSAQGCGGGSHGTGQTASGSTLVSLSSANVVAAVTVDDTPTSGASSVISIYKTTATLSVLASLTSEATATTKYQWYLSQSAAPRGDAVSGATTATVRFTGLSPGTDYYATVTAIDSAGTATTVGTAIPFHTLAATTTILLDVGDSITYGSSSSTSPPGAIEASELTAAGVPAVAINAGVPGSTTADWAPGGTDFSAAVAASTAAGGADVVTLMLGTNDSQSVLQVSAATYKTNIQKIITGLFTKIPTLKRVVLNYSPYVVPGSYDGRFDAASDTSLLAYETQLESLANGKAVVIGDRTAYVHYQNAPTELVDGVHPSSSIFLGDAWAAAYQQNVSP